MERASVIIADEMSWSRESNARKRIENAIKSKNYLSAAKIAFHEFNIDQNWDTGYGGKKWAEFCKYLVALGTAIELFKKSKTEEEKLKSSNDISIYMNVLNGLTHNTGSFSEKMIYNESNTNVFNNSFGNSFGNEYENKMREFLKIMNAKQLTHKEDVLPFIKQYMYNNPDSFLYREHFSKLLARDKPDLNRAEIELQEISKRKKLINYVINFIDFNIERIQNDLTEHNVVNYNNYITTILSLVNNVIWKNIKNKLLNIANEYNLISESHNVENDIENLYKYFKENEFGLFPGNYIIILDWKSKYEMSYNNGKIIIKAIDNYYQTLSNDFLNYEQIDLNRSIIDLPLLEKLENALNALKKMRSIINQEYNLGLPELN